MKYIDNVELCYIESFLRDEDNTTICKCKVTFANNIWSVSEWFTNKDYQHKGFGLKALKHTFDVLRDTQGQPKEIRYIWNGANDYVFAWMQRHFTPVSLMPLEVQKYASDDDWSAHIYILDKDKFLHYLDNIYD